MSFPARVIGILTSPRATFERVVAHPSWVAPWLMTTLVVGGAMFALLSTEVGQRAFVEQQVAVLEGFKQQVNDEMYRGLEKQALLARYIQPVSILVLTPIVLAAIAGILHGVFGGLLGGGGSFKQALAVAAHAGIVSAAQALFSTPLNYVRGSMSSATNLSVFFPFLPEGSFLANFLGTIDLFILWWLLVLSIGLSVLYRRKTGSIMTGFGILYLVIAVVFAAFKAA